MKKLLMTTSFVALAVLIGAPVLYYLDRIDLVLTKHIMNAATAAWFASAVCWMGRKEKAQP